MVARYISRDTSLAEKLLDQGSQEREAGPVSHAGQEDDGHGGPVAGIPWPVPRVLAVGWLWRRVGG